jgi:hypothetical protein
MHLISNFRWPFETENSSNNSLKFRKHIVFTLKISWIMSLKEIISLYSENHTIPINKISGKR